jgi:hypothetical protein
MRVLFAGRVPLPHPLYAQHGRFLTRRAWPAPRTSGTACAHVAYFERFQAVVGEGNAVYIRGEVGTLLQPQATGVNCGQTHPIAQQFQVRQNSTPAAASPEGRAQRSGSSIPAAGCARRRT